MDREELERIKEHEKERLRATARLKQLYRQRKQQRSFLEALREMTNSAQATLRDAAEAIRQLTTRTAHMEARLEVTRLDEEEDDEEVLLEHRARARLQALKEEMQSDAEEAADDQPPSARSGAGSSPSTPELPDKTIGRMKP